MATHQVMTEVCMNMVSVNPQIPMPSCVMRRGLNDGRPRALMTGQTSRARNASNPSTPFMARRCK